MVGGRREGRWLQQQLLSEREKGATHGHGTRQCRDSWVVSAFAAMDGAGVSCSPADRVGWGVSSKNEEAGDDESVECDTYKNHPRSLRSGARRPPCPRLG